MRWVHYDACMQLVLSLRDRLHPTAKYSTAEEVERRRRIYMQIDSIFFVMRAMATTQDQRNQIFLPSQVLSTIKEAHVSLRNDPYFCDGVGARKVSFRKFEAATKIDHRLNQMKESRPFRLMEQMSFKDALDYAVSLIESEAGAHVAPFSDLRAVIPDQKIAPAHFDVKAGKLVVEPVKSEIGDLDKEGAARAKAALLESGRNLLHSLKNSNADPRLTDTVENLQATLATEQDVVQIAMFNIGCEMMLEAFGDELSPAVSAQLRSQVVGVGLYVAQFPEWRRFADNAARIDLNFDDVVKIRDVANELVEAMEGSPDVVDAEVPKTLRFLRSTIDDPSRATTRAAFAVLRTIENLVAKVFSYGLEFIDGTISTASKYGQKAAAVALLTLAAGGALGLGPVTAKFADSAWMARAAQLVKDEISRLMTAEGKEH